MLPRHDKAASDAELLDSCRAGDNSAFSVMWERHHRAGRVAARNLAPSLDSDDLVSEAYLRIFELVQAGRGPQGNFRPYLYQTIRSVAIDRLRSPEQASADLDEIPDLTEAGPWEDDAFNLNATRQAFSTLNERWQTVLWYTEVEGMPPREVAKLLGISANSVSALAGRAREALQSAWVEAHGNSELAEAECRTALERLQRFQRGKLTARASREVAQHLETCFNCSASAREFRALNDQLALVLASLFLGGGGAIALLNGKAAAAVTASGVPGSGQTGAPGSTEANSASGVTSAASTPAAQATVLSTGMSVGTTLLTIAASVAVALAISAGIVMAVNASGESTFAEVEEVSPNDEASDPEHDSSSNPDKTSQLSSDKSEGGSEVSSDASSSTILETTRLLRADPKPYTPHSPTSPPPPIVPEPDPIPEPDPNAGDPGIHVGYECMLPNVVLMGKSNEYGVLLLRATANNGTPIELIDPIYDPALEGIEPGNVFNGGVFTDPYGNSFDFGFFTGTDPAPDFGWFGTDPSLFTKWNLQFGGLTVGEVVIEMRLVTPDGRFSPWTALDTGTVC